MHEELKAFEPEYYSGLNWRDALPLIGKVVEFSDDPDAYGWSKGILKKVITGCGKARYKMAEYCCFEYIRTAPETHAHPTVTLTVNGKEYVLPKPETEAPEKGTRYWYMLSKKRRIENYSWANDATDLEMLKNGNVHLTKSRAQAWANFWNEAILGAVK